MFSISAVVVIILLAQGTSPASMLEAGSILVLPAALPWLGYPYIVRRVLNRLSSEERA